MSDNDKYETKVIKIGDFTFVCPPYLHDERDYSRRKSTKNLIVHCSDTPRKWNKGADEIREWHVHDNGWMDIGYHFVIKRDGTIERGRPTWAEGAGVRGRNSDSIHICLVGGRGANGRGGDNFEPIQKRALSFLLSALMWRVSPDAKVFGHNDFDSNKECPSFDVVEWWKDCAFSFAMDGSLDRVLH